MPLENAFQAAMMRVMVLVMMAVMMRVMVLVMMAAMMRAMVLVMMAIMMRVMVLVMRAASWQTCFVGICLWAITIICLHHSNNPMQSASVHE